MFIFVYCSCGADRKSFNMKIFLLSLYISNLGYEDKSSHRYFKIEPNKGGENL